MILNGNDRVGEAKVYKTSLEMKQAKEIESLEKELESAKDEIRLALSRIGTKFNTDCIKSDLKRAINQNKKQGE